MTQASRFPWQCFIDRANANKIAFYSAMLVIVARFLVVGTTILDRASELERSLAALSDPTESRWRKWGGVTLWLLFRVGAKFRDENERE